MSYIRALPLAKQRVPLYTTPHHPQIRQIAPNLPRARKTAAIAVTARTARRRPTQSDRHAKSIQTSTDPHRPARDRRPQPPLRFPTEHDARAPIRLIEHFDGCPRRVVERIRRRPTAERRAPRFDDRLFSSPLAREVHGLAVVFPSGAQLHLPQFAGGKVPSPASPASQAARRTRARPPRRAQCRVLPSRPPPHTESCLATASLETGRARQAINTITATEVAWFIKHEPRPLSIHGPLRHRPRYAK